MPALLNQYARELDFAVKLTEDVGTGIDEATRAGGTASVAKPDGTPVTDEDLRGNALIHAAVQWHWPADAVLGEEDTPEDKRPQPGQRVWVADPVDGTWLLAAGLPWTVVSLALVVDGQPVVAVVHDPHAKYTVTATLGGGTWLNGRRLTVNSIRTIGRGAVLALPGGDVGPFDAAGVFTDAIRSGADVVTVGSAVHDASLVARGFAAGAVYPYTSPWDMAAVALLTTEAGGRRTTFDGNEQRYDRSPIRHVLLSNGYIHNDLVSLVAKWSR